MLLLAILLPPLALYLLVLGWINRRPRPVMMGGAWEFAGVLFALSGVLLVGGPALLTSLDEQSRWFWLLGETEPSRGGSAGAWVLTLGLVVRLLYFVVVAGGAAYLLRRGRRLTSIYNVDSPAIIPALDLAFQRLGLAAQHTGHSFLLGGKAPEVPAKESKSEAVQSAETQTSTPPAAAAPAVAGPNTTLNVDVFPAMRHVTLRWDPADAAVRREVERELARTLAESAGPEQETIHSGCLSLTGMALLTLALVAGGLVLLFHFYPPR